MSEIRTFDTGANRDTDEDKLDYEAFLSPLVLERYAQYLHEHRKLPDGAIRDGDNWQKGMPLSVYMKSGWRHFVSWWKAHRQWQNQPHPNMTKYQCKELEDAICAVIFNASGYLHEILKVRVVSQEHKTEEVVVGYDVKAGRPITVPPMKSPDIRDGF